MESNGSEPDHATLQELEAEAILARLRAVRNTLSSAEGVLRSPHMPHSLRAQVVEQVDAAWEALSGRTVDTEDRLHLLQAVDATATEASAGRGGSRDSGDGGGTTRTTPDSISLGMKALSRLPPELVLRLQPHVEGLGDVVAAWQKKTPGRGRQRGKWVALAALWLAATGKATSANAWETAWKESRWRFQRAVAKRRKRM
jgi:hypothetical protein